MNTPTPVDSSKIITFYSYKGGTGRTMAMANVAWILACNGKRVLVIDWDLEAPGLHRYFRPFLPDPELSDTPGLIDFFVRFWEATRVAEPPTTSSAADTRPWFYDYADLLAYAVPLDYEFPKKGELHFVGAGRQGASYASRVNWFRWDEFYEKLGGGVFLERVKEVLKAEYDYVLIDSRTGLSDTSGICTVQMPDDLVVCFTLNRQSIEGAAATARSADLQKRLSEDRPGLKIWPVPMRVDTSEKERLEAARKAALERFAQFLWHVPAADRPYHLGRMEIRYVSYYAYEEILAAIADAPGLPNSLLEDIQRLAQAICGTDSIRMPRLDPGMREGLVARYNAPGQTTQQRIFISFAQADRRSASAIELALARQIGTESVFGVNQRAAVAYSNSREAIEVHMSPASLVVVLVGPSWETSQNAKAEAQYALENGKTVVLVLTMDQELPPLQLRGRHWIKLHQSLSQPEVVGMLAAQLLVLLRPHPDDPNKGLFGGQSTANHRTLTATVASPDDKGWCTVGLRVESTFPTQPLEGEVEFHLHPTFRSRVKTVRVVNGIAKLRLSAWGAFTVGAVADCGKTRLELDLATLPDAPKEFTSR